MHFNPLKIKHLEKVVESTLLNTIYENAKNSPKSTADIGTFVNGEYVRFKNSKLCDANFVDYTSFKSKILELIEFCKLQVETQTGLLCSNYTLDFLYYKDGEKYWPHIDGQSLIPGTNTLTRGNLQRDITCNVYLNSDYTGGELYFPFFNLFFSPAPGDIIIYPSNYPYLHGVNKVYGHRYVLVIWFTTTPHAYQLADEIIHDTEILKILNHN